MKYMEYMVMIKNRYFLTINQQTLSYFGHIARRQGNCLEKVIKGRWKAPGAYFINVKRSSQTPKSIARVFRDGFLQSISLTLAANFILAMTSLTTKGGGKINIVLVTNYHLKLKE